MAQKEFEIVPGVIVAPLPLTERGFGLHLGANLKREPRFLYCNGNIVVQRNLEELTRVTLCAEHNVKANVAKYSPNGEWVCSGDEAGHCMVWAHHSFVIKNRIDVGKKVLDIAWSHDGQRIFAVGAGKDDKGKVFPWNTNNKLGEISGASKGFLSCDFKPSRPFRVIAGAEDFGVYFYKGPPFKFETYDKTHKNYVNCVRYNHTGEFYISVGSDKLIVVFEGKTGEKVREIVDKKNGHKGSIYEVCWSPDDRQFMTASADRTCKLWDFESGTVVHTWRFGGAKPTKEDMQVTCLWLEKFMLSVSLSGRINFLAPDQEEPVRIVTGHRKAIADMAVDRINGRIYTGDIDSRIVRTECKSGDSEDLFGDPHGGQQIRLLALSSDTRFLWSVGVDDCVAYSDVGGDNRQLAERGVKIDGAARAMISGNEDAELCLVATHKNKVFVFRGGEVAGEHDIGFAPVSMALAPGDRQVAIGGEDKSIHIFSYPEMKEEAVIAHQTRLKGNVVCLSYSPDGRFLASSDRNRHIWVWDTANFSADPINAGNGYQFHNAIPSSIAWSPDGNFLVSAGHDSNIFLWYQATQGSNANCKLENAFHQAIRAVDFISDTELVGVSADASIRFFNIGKP